MTAAATDRRAACASAFGRHLTRMSDTSLPPPECATVLFDGSCPLCCREIAFAKGRADERALSFVDISDPDAPIPDGADRRALMARFHVVGPDGTLRSGATAFGLMWAAIPGLGWLGRLVSQPVVRPFADGLYTLFLRVRPLLQRFARAAEHRSHGA